ncbi:uncharacterized protein LOC132867707 [Neoarius graeffei]|uniref:uncharacterized protein LOC132867707 n=1 Tax=Neoarius graeffei TaxID=443677 RepID=UPI00298CD3C8|nr:uncharacterized protein LOC132867707 [Neoarius graeffei]
MTFLLVLVLVLGAGNPAQASHEDNVFWQFANWTAKQHTNESCYVCHLMPVSSASVSLAPRSQNGSFGALQQLARSCLTLVCLGGYTVNQTHTHSEFSNHSQVKGLHNCHKNTSNNLTDCLKSIRTMRKFWIPEMFRPQGFSAQVPPKFVFPVCVERQGNTNFSLGLLSRQHCGTILDEYNSSSTYEAYLQNATCTSSRNCSVIAPDIVGTDPLGDDWYWVCGTRVYLSLPFMWNGRCGLTQFKSKIMIVLPSGKSPGRPRTRRSVSDDSFPPPEHQLESKWNKFWQSLVPQYGLTQVWNQLEVTHYRLATFVNATNAAIEGIRVELTALRLMTTQNRMALDIFLAKEGGVCAMVDDSCCTFVPANDDPSLGDITRQLEKMRQVAHDLKMDEQASSTWGWGWLHVLFGGLAPYISMIIPVLVIGLLVCICGPFLFRCCMDRIYNMMVAHSGYTPMSANTLESKL